MNNQKIDAWTEMFVVEGKTGQLETALDVVYGYPMAADDKNAVRALFLRECGCTPHQLFRATQVLLTCSPSADEVSNALNKVLRIFYRDLFSDVRWYETILAFKKFDDLESAETVN